MRLDFHRWNRLPVDRRGVVVAAVALVMATLPAQSQKAVRYAGEDTTGVARRPYTREDSAAAPERDEQLAKYQRLDDEYQVAVHSRMRPVGDYLGNIPWMVKEYHDEQSFIYKSTTGDAFGPRAHVFASPYIEGFTSINQVNAHGQFGLLSAIVMVDGPAAATLPAPYVDLHLRPGLNCVYLAHNGPDDRTAWRAYVLPWDAATQVCPRPTPGVASLDVHHVQSPRDAGQLDYPGAARFSESAAGQALISVRCLNASCLIGPAGFVARPRPAHAGSNYLMGRREGRVDLWYDEQVLGVKNAANVAVPWARASVTPVPGLATRSIDEFRGQWVRVATIWLSANPTGTKYGKYWGMRQGLNALELAYDGTRWQGAVTPVAADGVTPAGPVRRVIVTPHKHLDILVPGTARFRWWEEDEGLWVACDQGCCQVDAMMR